jgi:H+/Cl- antiporter ClcA
MTNDRYLIVSYFVVAALAVALACATWLYLRRSFWGISQSLSEGNFSRIWNAMFPAGLFLPAIFGFISVSYYGCSMSYEKIVKDRSYLIHKNQEQISSILLWIAGALLFWNLIIALALRFARTSSTQPSAESPDIPLHSPSEDT